MRLQIAIALVILSGCDDSLLIAQDASLPDVAMTVDSGTPPDLDPVFQDDGGGEDFAPETIDLTAGDYLSYDMRPSDLEHRCLADMRPLTCGFCPVFACVCNPVSGKWACP